MTDLQNAFHLIFSGLGAGNIGDEAMFKGFTDHFPLPDGSTVEVYDLHSPIVETLPEGFTYLDWKDDEKCVQAIESSRAILLVGGTPISCAWGLDWPLRALAQRLDQCHAKGLPVHAVGVGVDTLDNQDARDIFCRSFLSIISWTVRSVQCRQSLLNLGVPPEKIAVAADCAWLFTPDEKEKQWARDYWLDLGVNPDRHLLGVNVVNEKWPGSTDVKQVIAAGLDRLAVEQDVQVAFLCNEVREGDYFDVQAVKETVDLMTSQPVVVPNEYFTPAKMVALLSFCRVTLSQRYHFSLLSIVSGTPVVAFARGDKMISLLADLGQDPVGTMDSCNPDELNDRLACALADPPSVFPSPDCLRQMHRRAEQCSLFINPLLAANKPRLASITELESIPFRQFMELMNEKARLWGLREFTNWSKIWEYPWLWFNVLSHQDWSGRRLLDLGSEISPMPWFLASLGAEVTLVEHDPQWQPVWERLVEKTGLSVTWKIVTDERLPFLDDYFDVITSFSVIEHQPDKKLAVGEAARVLKPGGLFAVSYDICEEKMGMTFPEWNGKALTLLECENLLCGNTEFERSDSVPPVWNMEEGRDFVSWHLQSAPHHNYMVGAVALRKRKMKDQKKKPLDIMSCRNILLPRFDTFGDIVLVQGFVQALLDLLPDARITILVRDGYQELAELFPERVHWLTTDIDVYAESFDLEAALSLLERIKGEQFDAVISTTYNRVWLVDFLAARLPDVWRLALGNERSLPNFVLHVLPEMEQKQWGKFFDIFIPVQEKTVEQEKYQILWQALTREKTSLPHPKLQLDPDKEKKAKDILSQYYLTEGEYIVVFPAGTANVTIKTWPVEKYAQIIVELEQKSHVKILLAGHVSEREIVDRVYEQAVALGGRPEKWLGEDGELAVVAALLKMSLCYFGNDTGPMHIAAALGKPVLAIFSGGTWPRFIPLAASGRIFVMPLPCFYCHWHCFSKKSPCIDLIDVGYVFRHISEFIEHINTVQPAFEVIECPVSSETSQDIFTDLYKAFLSCAEGSHDRLGQIDKLHGQLAISEQDRQARLNHINHLAEQLSVSEQDRQARLDYINHLKGQLSVSEEDRELRLHVIHDLQEQIAGVQGELSRLQGNRYVRVLRKLRCLKYGE